MAIWNTEGYILSKVGICAGHSIYCDSKAELDSYMRGKIKSNFTEFSYIRTDKTSKNGYQPAVVHVPLPYNQTTECDYVMFRNKDIDPNRWCYGQVTNREYVNTNSTRLYFNFDYWLSYHDELKAGLHKSFVVRNHVYERDDWRGNQPSYKYQIPEGYSLPMFEFYDEESNNLNQPTFDSLKPTGFLLYATTNKHGHYNYTAGNVVNGSPTTFFVQGAQSYEEMGELVKAYNDAFLFLDTSSPDNIQGVVYLPDDIVTPFLRSDDDVPVVTDVINKTITLNRPNRDTLLRYDGTPFNNAKCLMSPYVTNVAKTFRGETIALNGEVFATNTNGTIYGRLVYCGGLDSHYRCVFSDNIRAEISKEVRFINLPDYPQVAVHSDSFAQYMGKEFIGDAVKTCIDVAYTVGAGASSNLLAINGARSIASDASNMISNMSAPDKAVGTSSPMDSAAYNTYNVVFYVRRPTIENLTTLDDYLLTYGYALNSFRTPNLCVRKYWTYIQTSNAVVTASLPYDAIQQFTTMLNNGVTLWNVKNCEIGDYKTENPDNE